MSDNAVYYSNQEISPISNEYLSGQICDVILKQNYLSDCNYLTFKGLPYYFSFNQGNNQGNSSRERKLFYESIGIILSQRIEKIKSMLNSSDDCFKDNIDILIENSSYFNNEFNKN